jgi:hypothetical protein
MNFDWKTMTDSYNSTIFFEDENNPKDEPIMLMFGLSILKYDCIHQFINKSCRHRIK